MGASPLLTTKENTMISRVLSALSTRKCRGCDDSTFHTAHLTALGRRRYTK